MTPQRLAALIAESHRRQLAGEDFQTVAVDIAEDNDIDYEDDAYTELQHSPDPGCGCATCREFDWED